jgi:hypothetical protein
MAEGFLHNCVSVVRQISIASAAADSMLAVESEEDRVARGRLCHLLQWQVEDWKTWSWTSSSLRQLCVEKR